MNTNSLIGLSRVLFILLFVLCLTGGCSKHYLPLQTPEIKEVPTDESFEGIFISPEQGGRIFTSDQRLLKRSQRKSIQFIRIRVVNLSMDTVRLSYDHLQVFADFEPVEILGSGAAYKKINYSTAGPVVLFGLGILGGIRYGSDRGFSYGLAPYHVLCLTEPYFFIRNKKINQKVESDLSKYSFEGLILAPGETGFSILALRTNSLNLFFRYKGK